MAADTKSLRSKYDAYSRWAERVAHLIILGLLIEIVSVWVLNKPPDEALFSIGANALIVLGVWGEILLERRAREAGDGLVAEAEARAAEANLETERLRAQFGWRAISAAQMESLVCELSKSIGPVNIMHAAGDAESSSYASQFVFAFRHAGWAVSLSACMYAKLEFGLRAPELHGECAEPSRAVREALGRAGIEFDSDPVPNWSSSTGWTFNPVKGGVMRPMPRFAEGPALLYVGPKPMPFAK